MVIINYWQQVSRHYILSHLLLGVIAAGFGFSANVFALPLTNTTPSSNAIIASIAKTNLQNVSDASIKKQNEQLFSFIDSQIEPNQDQYYTSQFTTSFQLLNTQGYSLANAIRAGPLYFIA